MQRIEFLVALHWFGTSEINLTDEELIRDFSNA